MTPDMKMTVAQSTHHRLTGVPLSSLMLTACFTVALLGVLRAASTLDGEFFAVVPFGVNATPIPFGEKNSVDMAFGGGVVASSQRGGRTPAGVIADPNDQGFWTIAARLKCNAGFSKQVDGLCARGGYEVDIEWQDSKLTRATIPMSQALPLIARSVIKMSSLPSMCPAGNPWCFPETRISKIKPLQLSSTLAARHFQTL